MRENPELPEKRLNERQAKHMPVRKIVWRAKPGPADQGPRPWRTLAASRTALAILALVAAGAAAAEPLTGAQIRDLFTGSTVSGEYLDGKPFSEFHAPDGRALGDSGFTVNVDACWNVDGDHVCYHYGPYKERKTYCFAVEKDGERYNLSVANDGRLNAVARVEKGNPHAHGDGGRRWSCDDLLASTPFNRHSLAYKYLARVQFR